MATKKKTIEQRAQAIIGNPKRYDVDTRDAIKYALSRKDADLAESVRRAERGEMILDLAEEQAKAERAAADTIAFYNRSDIPDFLTEAMLDALNEAAELKRVDTREDHDKPSMDFSRRGVAELFILAGRMSLRVDPNSPRTLATSIAAILAHPDCPVRLYNAIAEEVCSMSSDYCTAVSKTVPYIESCLVFHQRKEREREGGDAR